MNLLYRFFIKNTDKILSGTFPFLLAALVYIYFTTTRQELEQFIAHQIVSNFMSLSLIFLLLLFLWKNYGLKSNERWFTYATFLKDSDQLLGHRIFEFLLDWLEELELKPLYIKKLGRRHFAVDALKLDIMALKMFLTEFVSDAIEGVYNNSPNFSSVDTLCKEATQRFFQNRKKFIKDFEEKFSSRFNTKAGFTHVRDAYLDLIWRENTFIKERMKVVPYDSKYRFGAMVTILNIIFASLKSYRKMFSEMVDSFNGELESMNCKYEGKEF